MSADKRPRQGCSSATIEQMLDRAHTARVRPQRAGSYNIDHMMRKRGTELALEKFSSSADPDHGQHPSSRHYGHSREIPLITGPLVITG